MSRTPALALLGLALVLVAMPLAFSFAPFVIGVVMLVVAARRGHRELAASGLGRDPARLHDHSEGSVAA